MNKIIAISLIILLCFFGCTGTEIPISEETGEMGSPASPQSNLFSAKSILEGNISVCRVFQTSDAEQLFGVSPGGLEHSYTRLNFPGMGVSSHSCKYLTMQQNPSHLYIKIAQYEQQDSAEAIWEGYSSAPATADGTISGYEYRYTPSNTTNSILLKIPEHRMLLEVSADRDFPGASNEKLLSSMELFLSSLNLTDSRPHQFTEASTEKKTYLSSKLSFDYPANWFVSESYDEDVMVEDADGIILFAGIIPTTSEPMFSKENSTAEFNSMVERISPQTSILFQEVRESGEIKTYNLAYTDFNGRVVLLFFYQPLDKRPSAAALGFLIQPERYEFYKEDVNALLYSIKTQ